MHFFRIWSATTLLLLALAGAGHAADLYLSGGLAMSAASADSTGGTPFFSISGSDDDASPAWGGTLGFGAMLEEIVPSVGGLEAPPIGLRLEAESLWGRDYELRASGGDGFFVDAQASSVMTNAWVDLPVHPPLARLFGRIPLLDPLALYAGGGVGLASLEAETTDNVSRGSDSARNFAWQAGVGLAYEFTEWATVSAGWRYMDLGDLEADLAFASGGEPFGTHAIDFRSHELVTALRFDFYSRPLDEFVPGRWSLPGWKLPRPGLPKLRAPSLPGWMPFVD